MDHNHCAVFCNCGCQEGFVLDVFDGTGVLSFVSGDFYARQAPVRGFFQEVADCLAGPRNRKARLLKEVCVSAEDLLAFKEALQACEGEEDAEADNCARVVVRYDKDFGSFWVYLVAGIRGWRRLRYGYRMYDLVVDKCVAGKLVADIDAALRKAGK